MRDLKPTYKELEKKIEELENKLRIENSISEKKITAIFNNSPIGIIIFDTEGNTLELNDKIVEILGSPSKEYTKKIKILNFQPLKDIGFLDKFEECKKKQKVVFLENKYITKHKKEIFVQCIFSPIIDENNNILKIQCVINDFTKLKKSEQDLLESEKKYKELAEGAIMGIVIHDMQGSIKYVNPVVQEIMKFDNLQDVYKKNISDFIHPNYAEQAMTAIQRLIVEKKSFQAEQKFIRNDGKAIFVELYGKQIIFDNQTAIQVTFNDITKRKKAERALKKQNEEYLTLNEEYKTINEELMVSIEKVKDSQEKYRDTFMNSIASIYTFNKERQFTSTNPAGISLLGYSKEELLQMKISDVDVQTETNIIATTEAEKTLLSGNNVVNYEHRLIRKDGKEITLLNNSIPLKDKNGNVVGVQSFLLEITDRKEAEIKLKKAKEKAEESDRLKTEFINNMSHEIRTPMNGILGFSDFLSEPGLTDEKRRQYVNIIKSSGNQLMRTIDDILEISRLGTKQVQVAETQICLNGLLLEHFSIFDIKAKESKIPLYLQKGLSDKDSTIFTDETKLNKILSNLLENALKFTNKGFVEFGYILKTENELEIYVKDTGVGIKPENLKNIFNRFSQEEKKISRKVGGLGLGLSIAKENAKLLGGNITVESQKGEGAKFILTIPYKPANVKNKLPENLHTILIAEDEEVNFLYLSALLETYDLPLNILHAKHGKEAVEKCKENRKINLVFMDMKMPIMSGFEATGQIKEIYKDLPVIAQTAYSTKEDKEKAISAGCDDFISKPINKDMIDKIINKFLKTEKSNFKI